MRRCTALAATIITACAPAALPSSPATSSAPEVERTAALSRPVAACPSEVRADHVTWSSDSRYLATSCFLPVCPATASQVDLWDIAGGKLLRSVDAGLGSTKALFGLPGWLATQSDALTGGARVTLSAIANVQTAQSRELRRLADVAFDGQSRAFVAGRFGELFVLDSRTRAMTERPALGSKPTDRFVALRYATSSGLLVVIDEEQGVELLDPKTLARAVDKTVSLSNLTGFGVSPNSEHLAIAKFRGGIAIYSTRDLRLERSLRAAIQPAAVTTVDWVDDQHLVSSDGSAAIHWDIATGKSLPLGRAASTPRCQVALSAQPVSKLFAMVDAECQLSIRSAATGSASFQARLPQSEPKSRVAFKSTLVMSPRGDTVATINDDCALLVSDANSGRPLYTTTFGKGRLCGAHFDFSPDGKLLALADGAIHLLRMADGREATLHVAEQAQRREAFVVSNGELAGDGRIAHCFPERPALVKQDLLAAFADGR